MTEFILDLLQQNPLFAILVTIVGVMRIINKPLFSIFHAIANVTPTTKDNELLSEFESSNAYRMLLYVMDWFASVKVKQ